MTQTKNADARREILFALDHQMTQSRRAMSFFDCAMSSLRETATTFAGRMIEIDKELSAEAAIQVTAMKFKT